MPSLLGWLARLFGKRTPPPLARPTIGVVCHRLNDEDIAALRSMGVRHVRLSLYGNLDGAQWLDRAVAEGLDVVGVTYRVKEDFDADAARWPTVRWQVGNEPDPTTMTPQDAAQMTVHGSVACGLGHGVPKTWADAFKVFLRPTQVFAFHIYGQPLSGTMTETLAAMGPTGWITEIGDRQASELEKSLKMIDGTKFQRVYVYALWSDADGYTLTDAHRNVIRKFTTS